MTYPVQQRASSAWAHVVACLRTGLAAQITAINADLTTRAQAWRVPAIESGQILLRAQEPDLPQGLSYPQVRVVPGVALTRQDASGRSGLTGLGVSVACYLNDASLIGAQELASVSGDGSEELILLALADLATACAQTLQDPTTGVYSSSAGIVQIEASGVRAPQIHYVPASGYRASAMWCALEYRIILEETY